MARHIRTRKRKYLAETDNHLQPSKLLSSANSLLLEAVSKGRQTEVASLLESSIDQISAKTLVEAVFQASANGHKRLLQHLIRHGANVNSRCSTGNTALVVAAEHGYVDIVKLLVKSGANINGKTKCGKTALIVAAEKACFLPVIEFLVSDCHTDVNIQDKEGRTALMVSVQLCDIAAMRVLMYHKEVDFTLRDRKDRTAFDIAKEYGVVEEFMALQECIGDCYLNPVIVAVKKGNVRLLREFIDSDSYDIEHADKEGFTPLMIALKMVWHASSRDILQTLIASGANVNSLHTGHPERTPLLYAAELGNVDGVKLLVEYGASVNTQTPVSKISALMVAAQNGFSEIVELLLKNHADWRIKDFKDKTALTLALVSNQISCADVLIRHGADFNGEDLIRAACMEVDSKQYLAFPSVTNKIAASIVSFMLVERSLRSKNYALVEFLLDHGKDVKKHFKHLFLMAVTRDVQMAKLFLDRGVSVNSVDPFGHSALMKAACRDNRTMVELLIQGKARKNVHCEGKTALTFTIGKHAMNGLEALLQGGVDVNYVPKHSSSCVPLHQSISLGFDDVTEQLIKYGANVNYLDREGQSPLMLAIKRRNYHVIGLLIASGANLDTQMNSEYIPLHTALTNQDIQTAEMLLKAGADVNVADSKGKTALMLCSQISTTDVLHMLLKNGADANASDETGATALHYAVKHSIILTDKAEILVKYGADINKKDNEGQTAFMVASRFCKTGMLQFLLAHGADMNAQDRHGSSALIDAIRAANENTEFLISCGADLNVRNNAGYTALMIAATESNDLAMMALLNAGADIHYSKNKNYNILSLALAKYNKCRLCLGEDSTCKHHLCIEMLINAGAKPELSNQCTLALYKAIICNNIRLVQLLVGCGIPPLELPRNCEDLLSYSVPQKFFMSICGVSCHQPVLQEFLLALNASIHARSPLSTAIFCKNAAMCEFFIRNWYFNVYDMTRISLSILNPLMAPAEGGFRLSTVCEGLFSKPFSLATQSFVAVAGCVGGGRDREERIRSLPIPQVMQERLLYSSAKNDVIEPNSDSQKVVNFM